MSRSNNTELISPAQKFFEWSGSEGTIRYFDKSLGEKGENVDVPIPFKFLILDKVAQVTGGIDVDGGGYVGFWSNAIKNTKTQQLTVRSKRGVEAQGLYEEIKGLPGMKFMTGLYIAFYDENEQLQIGYLKLKGAALTAWIEFTKSHRNIYEGAFGITGKEKKKKGTNNYFEPKFIFSAKVSDEADEMAKELDRHLQEYLTAYFAQAGQEFASAATAGGMPTHTGAPEHGDAWEPSDADVPDDEEF